MLMPTHSSPCLDPIWTSLPMETCWRGQCMNTNQAKWGLLYNIWITVSSRSCSNLELDASCTSSSWKDSLINHLWIKMGLKASKRRRMNRMARKRGSISKRIHSVMIILSVIWKMPNTYFKISRSHSKTQRSCLIQRRRKALMRKENSTKKQPHLPLVVGLSLI